MKLFQNLNYDRVHYEGTDTEDENANEPFNSSYSYTLRDYNELPYLNLLISNFSKLVKLPILSGIVVRI